MLIALFSFIFVVQDIHPVIKKLIDWRTKVNFAKLVGHSLIPRLSRVVKGGVVVQKNFSKEIDGLTEFNNRHLSKTEKWLDRSTKRNKYGDDKDIEKIAHKTTVIRNQFNYVFFVTKKEQFFEENLPLIKLARGASEDKKRFVNKILKQNNKEKFVTFKCLMPIQMKLNSQVVRAEQLRELVEETRVKNVGEYVRKYDEEIDELTSIFDHATTATDIISTVINIILHNRKFKKNVIYDFKKILDMQIKILQRAGGYGAPASYKKASMSNYSAFILKCVIIKMYL